jgi:thiaminase/transcriptional activator TenA
MTAASFTDRMLASAKTTWEAALAHRFFREVTEDTIEDAVFARYLRIEYGFIDSAAVTLGYAVAKAPSFQERRRLAFGLHGLVTDQERFFVEAFERMGAPADARTGLPPQGPSTLLHVLFLTVARTGRYEDILASMLAAERMYLTWCSKAAQTPSSRPYIRDWVELHTGGAFAEHVAWLRSELDRRGPALSASRRAHLCELFEHALAAEIPFHDAAYA